MNILTRVLAPDIIYHFFLLSKNFGAVNLIRPPSMSKWEPADLIRRCELFVFRDFDTPMRLSNRVAGVRPLMGTRNAAIAVEARDRDQAMSLPTTRMKMQTVWCPIKIAYDTTIH